MVTRDGDLDMVVEIWYDEIRKTEYIANFRTS